MAKWLSELEGFEDFEGYTVSEDGSIFSYKKHVRDSLTGRILGSLVVEEGIKINGSIDSKGYRYVDIKNKNGKRKCPKVHRLVALAFLENKDSKPQINHIDGVKLNNDVNNLEWVTNSENQLHAYKIGLSARREKEKNYQWGGEHDNCKRVRQMDLNGNEIAVHNSLAMAGRSLGKGYSSISKVCNGKRETAYGYMWEFVK